MSLRTVMQAGPLKANDLFARLSETSDGAVKTREKLFAELKTELELHTGLEEQHLFPILRRNAETKELVAEAMKDNKEIRAKLAELDALSKNDELFPERLKELQKAFRQHARDEKRELLPAVQRALSEEQVQSVAEKIEAGVAEAEQARQAELEERRLKVRQEREEAERQAEQAAAAQQVQEEAERRTHDAAEAVAHTAMAAQTTALRMAKNAAATAQRSGAEIQGITETHVEAVKPMIPDFQTIATLPKVATSAMTQVWSAWVDLSTQTTHARAQLSQQLLRQGHRLATTFRCRWCSALDEAQRSHHAAHLTQEGFRAFSSDRMSGQ